MKKQRMTSAEYAHRDWYYTAMKDLLKIKIGSNGFRKKFWDFREKFWSARSQNMDIDEQNGYNEYYDKSIKPYMTSNEKLFQQQYSNVLYNAIWTKDDLYFLKQYEQGAQKLGIQGERFFDGIYNFIEPYIREYYPSSYVGFDKKYDVDEKTLVSKVQAVVEVLDRNKERWR